MSSDKVPATLVEDDRAIVVGINFGNSNASIAVITKEGNAECIANEDGERQIAAAISFHGEEMYIGNQATPQLVKNAQNTITGFRNLLGKKFSDISSATLPSTLASSAPVIQHPTLSDTPCYSVQVLVPSPSPLPRGTPTPTASSRPSTQHPTPLATPRSEPVSQTRHITPHDASVLFLKSLYQSAADFLGKTPDGAVLTVPGWFDDVQRAALRDAAKEAGVNVLQFLEEDAAAAVVLGANETNPDRTALLIDWGATDLVVSLLSVRAGLVHVLASKRAPELGTACTGSVDEVLVKHFAKEFTKKTSESLQVCPAPNPAAQRAQTKLALALLHVKRSFTSAHQKASTQISIESLAAGLDFSAPLNRTRAAGLLAPVFAKVSSVVREVLAEAGWTEKREWVDSVVWVGGGGRLGGAGAGDALIGVLGENATDEDVGAPEEVLARACAVHARALIELQDDSALRDAFTAPEPKSVRVTQKTLGVIVPEAAPAANGSAKPPTEEDEDLGGQWIPIIPAETPLPARRTVRFAVPGDERAAFEVWEATEVVRVRRVKVDLPPLEGEDEEEEEEEEEERERGVHKEAYLGALVLPLSATAGKKKGTKRVSVRIDVESSGALVASAREGEGEWVTLNVGSA